MAILSRYRPLLSAFGAIAILFLGGSAFAQNNDNVVVSTQKVNDRYDVFVENRNPYDITLTLNIRGTNISTSKRTPYKNVYAPATRRLALQIFIDDKKKGFNVNTDYTWFMGDVNARHDDSFIYDLPYRRGETYKLGQGYGGEFSHTGKSYYALDFMLPEETPVLAARKGVVIMAHGESDRGGPSRKYSEDSNYIVIRHNDGTLGEYAHLKRDGVLVDIGQKVRKGEKIGLSGNTGFSSGPHLHFTVTKVTEDGTSQSLPFKFRAKRGVVTEPREGEDYTAI
ncbi:MAG: M23 family metallopeptidase [Balneolaceae bacterium]|nr:M23 family metallopeptidase [Balneolaceae bacterium]